MIFSVTLDLVLVKETREGVEGVVEEDVWLWRVGVGKGIRNINARLRHFAVGPMKDRKLKW